MAVDWALDAQSWYLAFKISGSSLLTLGFALVDTFPTTVLVFSEATIGLLLIALLIACLPTIYAAFSRREAAVTMLEVRAGSPPSAVELLNRYTRLKRLGQLGELWTTWEAWFVDLEDSQADLCLRAGYLALRYIAAFFRISSHPNPSPTDPISVSRAEFEAALDELAEAGVPLKADREQAWRDFSGWRVNYDSVLLTLAELTIAPPARWSSDRRLADAPAPILRWRKGHKLIETHEWIPPLITRMSHKGMGSVPHSCRLSVFGQEEGCRCAQRKRDLFLAFALRAERNHLEYL
jgi:hypothetical protein